DGAERYGVGLAEMVGQRMKRVLCLAALLWPGLLPAQQTYAVIITGLGGEKEFDQQFKEVSDRLATGLKKAGLAGDHIISLPPDRARKDEVAKTFQDLAGKTRSADTLLVFLVG